MYNNTKDRKKELIIQIAKELFAKNGFKATTFREIAKKGNLTFSSITYYFKTKEGLLQEIIQELGLCIDFEIIYILEKDFNSIEEFKFILTTFLNSVLIFGYKNWQSVKIIASETMDFENGANANEFSKVYLEKLEAFVKKARKKGIIKKTVQPLLFADIIMALIMDQILYFDTKKKLGEIDISNPFQREKWINSCLDLLINGIL